MMKPLISSALLVIACVGCASMQGNPTPKSFDDDVAFLKRHVDVLVLADAGNAARVAVVPEYQGRVMTSTAGVPGSPGYGWINRKLIKSGKTLPHMNPYGGEDRFWMGPEGGQFAIFFPPDVPYEVKHWQTPAIIDTEPFQLASASATRALFRKRATFNNRAGFTFSVQIDRTVRLLNAIRAEEVLGISVPPTVAYVGFETENLLRNVGEKPWTKDTGLLSIWILGMFNPTPSTTVVIPIKPGSEAELGPSVIDNYFGKVPAERLVVTNHAVFFVGDGLYRSKIGIPPPRSLPTVGSYDEQAGVLTIVNYSLPENARDYVNSLWVDQEQPFAGDVVNSYNDGPLEGGQHQLGPFYEIETSSPAAELGPGAEITHTHRTFHFQGNEADLDAIAQATLHVSLADIQNAF